MNKLQLTELLSGLAETQPTQRMVAEGIISGLSDKGNYDLGVFADTMEALNVLAKEGTLTDVDPQYLKEFGRRMADYVASPASLLENPLVQSTNFSDAMLEYATSSSESFKKEIANHAQSIAAKAAKRAASPSPAFTVLSDKEITDTLVEFEARGLIEKGFVETNNIPNNNPVAPNTITQNTASVDLLPENHVDSDTILLPSKATREAKENFIAHGKASDPTFDKLWHDTPAPVAEPETFVQPKSTDPLVPKSDAPTILTASPAQAADATPKLEATSPKIDASTAIDVTPKIDTSPKVGKWQKFITQHQRGVGAAEAGVGIAATALAHNRWQHINNQLDMKLSNGEKITMGDRVKQGAYGLTTAVASVATLDGLSRAATKQGIVTHAERIANGIKSTAMGR
jgi:hypothetical protein